MNSALTRQYRELFPVDAAGQPQSDHIATLLDMHADAARVPQDLSLRSLNGLGVPGEDKYMLNKYLRRTWRRQHQNQRRPHREGQVLRGS